MESLKVFMQTLYDEAHSVDKLVLEGLKGLEEFDLFNL